jgi:hypothetical protein
MLFKLLEQSKVGGLHNSDRMNNQGTWNFFSSKKGYYLESILMACFPFESTIHVFVINVHLKGSILPTLVVHDDEGSVEPMLVI